MLEGRRRRSGYLRQHLGGGHPNRRSPIAKERLEQLDRVWGLEAADGSDHARAAGCIVALEQDADQLVKASRSMRATAWVIASAKAGAASRKARSRAGTAAPSPSCPSPRAAAMRTGSCGSASSSSSSGRSPLPAGIRRAAPRRPARTPDSGSRSSRENSRSAVAAGTRPSARAAAARTSGSWSVDRG